MDKFDSLAQKGKVEESKANGQGAEVVAHLVSALLDDVTVGKPLSASTSSDATLASINGKSASGVSPVRSEPVHLASSHEGPIRAYEVPTPDIPSAGMPLSGAEAASPATNGHTPIKTTSSEENKVQEQTNVEPAPSATPAPTLKEFSSFPPTTQPLNIAEHMPASVSQPAEVVSNAETHHYLNGDAGSDGSAPPLAHESYQSDGMAINIKGRADGVIIEIGRGNWEILLEALRKRLDQAGGFFRGGSVALDLAERSLQEPDLHALCDLLVGYNMKPALVQTSSDRTFQSALMLGLAGTLESKDGRPLETVNAAPSNQEAQTHYVYRGALRSGQILKRRSHVLIVGDVNPGSEVIATGDILVWGRLRGTAHAGVEGDTRAIVAAFDIDPIQLRIADAVAMGSGAQSEHGYRWLWSRNTEKRPEVARLVNGQITIEVWDEAKTGGSPVLKKRR